MNAQRHRSSCVWWTVGGLLALALTCAQATASRAADVQGKESGPVALELSLLDVEGQPHRLAATPDRAALVLIFTSIECPIANGYIPELNRLYESMAKQSRRVEFCAVVCDRPTTRAAAAKHAREFHCSFPVLFDGSGELAAALGPTHTPEAFVIDRAGQVVYRGRIDDAWADLGKRRASVTHHDLSDAVSSVLAGRRIGVARTTPVGCPIESNKQSDKEPQVTYTRDIAPILQANCVTCHRDGEVAPFPLTSFQDAAKRAVLLASVAESRFMPPWKPEPGFGHFVDERRLSERQIALLNRWAESGAAEGDPADLPPAPTFTDGWQLGEPDLVVNMPEPFEVPAGGRDVFRNFVIPLGVEEEKLVAAVEFRPGNRRVVHHALFYLDTSAVARKKDAADLGPGYGSFGGPGFLPSGALGGWAPGGTPHALPDNMGRLLRKNSDLVLQIHYHPSGKPELDQSVVGIHFVKRPSRKIVAGMLVMDRSLDIPAGADKHPMSGSYTLPRDVTLVGITPHMHLLGREMKATATLPDGTEKPLIWIKDWNFNWQDQYLFAEPIRLPKGTKLVVDAVYDNSAKNPLNPNTPPRLVKWGEQTTDEMFICFFMVTTDRPQELMALIVDNLAAMTRRGALTGRLRPLNE